MKPYPKYKPSDIQWLGDIPEHWEVKKLKYVSSIKLGKMLTPEDKGNFFLKPYLRAQNINWLKTNVEDVKEMWFSETELETFRIKYNDLLVSEGGEVGRTCIWEDELEECYIQNSVHKVSFSDIHVSKFFLYQFYYFGQMGHFDSIVNRISIAHLTGEKLKEVNFIVPPLPEQTAIAQFLDQKTAQIDTLIAQKQRLITLLKEERMAFINEILSDESYPLKKLKYVVEGKLEYGANESAELDDRSLPRYIRITDFGNNGKLKDETFKSLPFEKANEYLLKDGDILFARSGATVGKTFQFKNYEGIACFAGYLIKAMPNPKVILSDYLYYFTKSGIYENWKDSIFVQATIQNIGADKYNQLEIPVPPLKTQQKIVESIETTTGKIDATLAKILQEIELLKEYRVALISEVVTGKISVI